MQVDDALQYVKCQMSDVARSRADADGKHIHHCACMQVQNAVTEAAQPLDPPPPAGPSALEPAAGGVRPYRSLKTPSATDLVENRGAGAPAPDASNSSAPSGGSAAFPFPGPTPPLEAPAMSAATADALPVAAAEPADATASAPGPGWATFDDSRPPTQPAPAAGSAEMSKGFGSFEQFAQVLFLPCALLCCVPSHTYRLAGLAPPPCQSKVLRTGHSCEHSRRLSGYRMSRTPRQLRPQAAAAASKCQCLSPR
jgi:hypothetical protein